MSFQKLVVLLIPERHNVLPGSPVLEYLVLPAVPADVGAGVGALGIPCFQVNRLVNKDVWQFKKAPSFYVGVPECYVKS